MPWRAPGRRRRWPSSCPGGTGADVVILATGTTNPEVTGGAYRCLGKGGTLVLTGLADHTRETTVALPGNITTVFEQRVQGALYGMCNAYRDIPRLLRLYEEGKLSLRATFGGNAALATAAAKAIAIRAG